MYPQSGSLSERLRAGLTPLVDAPGVVTKGSVASLSLPFTGESFTSLDTTLTETDMAAVSTNL